MTVLRYPDGQRLRAAPVPFRLSWAAAGVIFAVVSGVGGSVAAYGALLEEVHEIRQELPPGGYQALDERTKAILRELQDLKAARQ